MHLHALLYPGAEITAVPVELTGRRASKLKHNRVLAVRYRMLCYNVHTCVN